MVMNIIVREGEVRDEDGRATRIDTSDALHGLIVLSQPNEHNLPDVCVTHHNFPSQLSTLRAELLMLELAAGSALTFCGEPSVDAYERLSSFEIGCSNLSARSSCDLSHLVDRWEDSGLSSRRQICRYSTVHKTAGLSGTNDISIDVIRSSAELHSYGADLCCEGPLYMEHLYHPRTAMRHEREGPLIVRTNPSIQSFSGVGGPQYTRALIKRADTGQLMRRVDPSAELDYWFATINNDSIRTSVITSILITCIIPDNAVTEYLALTRTVMTISATSYVITHTANSITSNKRAPNTSYSRALLKRTRGGPLMRRISPGIGSVHALVITYSDLITMFTNRLVVNVSTILECSVVSAGKTLLLSTEGLGPSLVRYPNSASVSCSTGNYVNYPQIKRPASMEFYHSLHLSSFKLPAKSRESAKSILLPSRYKEKFARLLLDYTRKGCIFPSSTRYTREFLRQKAEEMPKLPVPSINPRRSLLFTFTKALLSLICFFRFDFKAEISDTALGPFLGDRIIRCITLISPRILRSLCALFNTGFWNRPCFPSERLCRVHQRLIIGNLMASSSITSTVLRVNKSLRLNLRVSRTVIDRLLLSCIVIRKPRIEFRNATILISSLIEKLDFARMPLGRISLNNLTPEVICILREVAHAVWKLRRHKSHRFRGVIPETRADLKESIKKYRFCLPDVRRMHSGSEGDGSEDFIYELENSDEDPDRYRRVGRELRDIKPLPLRSYHYIFIPDRNDSLGSEETYNYSDDVYSSHFLGGANIRGNIPQSVSRILEVRATTGPKGM